MGSTVCCDSRLCIAYASTVSFWHVKVCKTGPAVCRACRTSRRVYWQRERQSSLSERCSQEVPARLGPPLAWQSWWRRGMQHLWWGSSLFGVRSVCLVESVGVWQGLFRGGSVLWRGTQPWHIVVGALACGKEEGCA